MKGEAIPLLFLCYHISMKLILSSCDFNNEHSKQVIIDNLGKPIEECKLLFIPNEKADHQRIYSNKYYNRLKKHGFKKENIYVFDENKANDFSSLTVDAIYVGGGNTFGTYKKIKDSGFDKAIINYINKGVVYIGGSCGAHIVSKSIKHLLTFDDNYCNLTDYNGLGLFNGVIIVHYGEKEFNPKKREEIYQELIKENKYPVYKLTNDESLVIIDEEISKY